MGQSSKKCLGLEGLVQRYLGTRTAAQWESDDQETHQFTVGVIAKHAGLDACRARVDGTSASPSIMVFGIFGGP